MRKLKIDRQCITLGLSVLLLGIGTATAWAADEIIHDAEYYVLEAQHGDKWAAEDKELKAKLAELKAQHGTPPNIIHIMWDDTAFGDVGIGFDDTGSHGRTMRRPPHRVKRCAAGQSLRSLSR